MSRQKQLIRLIDSPDTDRIVVDGLTTVKMHIIPFARIYVQVENCWRYGYDRSFKFYKLNKSNGAVDIWSPVDSFKYHDKPMTSLRARQRHEQAVADRKVSDFSQVS